MHMSYFGYDAVGILISSVYANESYLELLEFFPFILNCVILVMEILAEYQLLRNKVF